MEPPKIHNLKLRIFLLITLFVSTRANAQTPMRLSLTDAIRMATTGSPLTAAAQSRLFGSEARYRAAGLPDFASITLAAPFGRDTTQLDSPLLISQILPLGDKLRQRIHASRADRDASRSDLSLTTADLVLNAQTAYYEAARAETERQLAVETVATAQAFADTAQTQFAAGDVPRSNVVRSKIELTRAETALSMAATDAENRLATLRSLLELPPNTALTLADPLTFTPANYTLEALQMLALRTRPELISAQRVRESRLSALHLARLLDTPDLLFEARHNSYRIDAGNDSLRIGIVIPLFDYGRNRAEQRAAQFALLEQDATLSEEARIIKLEVDTAFRNLELARRTVTSFQSGRLEQSKELLQLAQTGYQQGANSYLELLDAQNLYRSEQGEFARALAAWNEAKATLQRAVGGTLP